ncbi:MAG: hypothetical protein AAF191_19640, partial [Verrucomicrobiota bacterium]
MKLCLRIPISLGLFPLTLLAQLPPYEEPPEAEPPYYRVRYDAEEAGPLIFPVQYTLWVPADVTKLRGLVVHQHGCGEGSCRSGQTGAFDLHWQALARAHDCALLSPSYEQPQEAECQQWCDPRNGSATAFFRALHDLGVQSAHPELEQIPWALWGHSGGGHWVGGMTLLYPERVIATWLRSGVPVLAANPERPSIRPYTLPAAALSIPMMANPGTKEGVTVKEGKFSKVWPANETFFHAVRGQGGLIGMAIDPLSGHECGNQRYLAIPWLGACLSARLPKDSDSTQQPMAIDEEWLAPLLGKEAVAGSEYSGNPRKATWLPNAQIAQLWMEYVQDTAVGDSTPPPRPTDLKL